MVLPLTARWTCMLTGAVFLVNSVQAVEVSNKPGTNAGSAAIGQEYWAIQLENDFFARTGDRYYTHGTQISRMLMDEPPLWMQDIAMWFPAFQSDGQIKGVNYTIGQKIFTPDNTGAAGLVTNDRPYAGYLYISAGILSRVSRQNNVDTGNLLEITLGVVGPASLAEQTQTNYHELINIDVPNGWDNQLSNEPGVGLSYARFWRHIKPLNSNLQFGMTPHVNITLGNVYTYAASGIMFRTGNYLLNDLAPPNIRPGFPGLAFFRTRQQSSWYLFAGIEGRTVARNIFLDGNTFSDSHSVDKKTLVGDLQYGFVYQTGDIRLSISNMIRTKEYENQKEKTHFGAVNVSFLI